ncbi:MAG: hypothetical protein ABIP81_01935 [Terriglobales bacterium]
MTTATGGCVNAWDKVAGLLISTSGVVVITLCSVTTSVTGLGTTVLMTRRVTTVSLRVLFDLADLFAVARDLERGLDELAFDELDVDELGLDRPDLDCPDLDDCFLDLRGMKGSFRGWKSFIRSRMPSMPGPAGQTVFFLRLEPQPQTIS